MRTFIVGPAISEAIDQLTTGKILMPVGALDMAMASYFQDCAKDLFQISRMGIARALKNALVKSLG